MPRGLGGARCRESRGGVGRPSGTSAALADVLGGMAPGYDDLPDLRSDRWLEVDTVPPADWFAMVAAQGGARLPETEARFHGPWKQQSLRGRPLTGALWTERVTGLSEGDWSGIWSHLLRAYRGALWQPTRRNSSCSDTCTRPRPWRTLVFRRGCGSEARNCVLCGTAGQNFPDHLFKHCSVSHHIWIIVGEHLHSLCPPPLSAATLVLGRPKVVFEHVMLYVHLVWGSYGRRIRCASPPPALGLVQMGRVDPPLLTIAAVRGALGMRGYRGDLVH
ncbi:hypothetical protein V1522DRAFT_122669 [Lipomyces starkeyi]